MPLKQYRKPGTGFATQLPLILDPPPTKRGGKPPIDEIEAGIDWMSATFGKKDLQKVYMILQSHFPEMGNGEDCIPMKSFKEGLVFSNGMRLSWHPDYSYMHLLMKGETCTSAGAGLMAVLLKDLDQFCNWCRVDANFDVRRSDALLPTALEEAELKGEAVGYRTFTTHRSRKDGTSSGTTFSAGKRGSNGGGKHFRAYEKSKGDSGELTHVRYEVEYSSERANLFVQSLIATVGEGVEVLKRFLIGAVYGAIDFRVPGNTNHSGRRKQCNWWKDFFEGILRIPLRLAPVAFQSPRWIEASTRQYSALFYEYSRRYPKHYIDLLARFRVEGKERYEKKLARSTKTIQSLESIAGIQDNSILNAA